MTEAAQAFLAVLNPDELAKTTMKFDDPARLDWTNIPKKVRKGLPISDMTPEEKKLCHNLLRAALSRVGLRQSGQNHVVGKQSPRRREEPEYRLGPRSRALFPHHFRRARGDGDLGLEF